MRKVNDFTIQLFDSKYIDSYDRYTIAKILKESTLILLISNDEINKTVCEKHVFRKKFIDELY